MEGAKVYVTLSIGLKSAKPRVISNEVIIVTSGLRRPRESNNETARNGYMSVKQ